MIFLYPILLFPVEGYDKIHIVDCTSNVRVEKDRDSCELIRYDVDLKFYFSLL